MKCPHCLVDFHDNSRTVDLSQDIDGLWDIEIQRCSACKRDIYKLRNFEHVKDAIGRTFAKRALEVILIRPKVSGRPPVPAEVPREFAEDYLEAGLVISDSPKASAALSAVAYSISLERRLELSTER